MNGITTVDELIRSKNLSPEEEEQLREIIEECRRREVLIKEASDSARQNIESLARSFGAIVETISDVGKAVEDLHEEVGRLQLRMMPEANFFHD
jgi:uncharacterized coiled-coil DUF342 family protein